MGLLPLGGGGPPPPDGARHARVVLISDTDSCFLNVNPWWEYVSQFYELAGCEEVTRTNIMNIIIHIVGKVIAETYQVFTGHMGIPKEKRKIVAMKSEFRY